MEKIDREVFDFLRKLRKNNNRPWFKEHKAEFDPLRNRMKKFFEAVNTKMQETDSLSVFHMHRIYRDVRFSKDKTPYRTHFSLALGRTKPMLRGNYYIHLEEGNFFAGGGFWGPNAEDLLRVRKEIDLDASELRAIIAAPKFQEYFGSLKGDELKTAPKGFDRDHPDIDLLRKKQYLLIRPFTDEQAFSDNFFGEVINTFLAMRPFLDYMSAVLTTNVDGESLY